MTTTQMRLDGPVTEPEPLKEQPRGVARLKTPNRAQWVFSNLDLDQLIPADHLARAIDSLVKQMPDAGFLVDNKSVAGHAGRPRTDPRMLVAIWVYAYSQGMGEAGAIAEEMKYEPALRWLAGNLTLSGRTLSGFRVEHEKALRGLFAELLGMLSKAELVDLKQVTIDGTKIQALASAGSFRREASLKEHIARAATAIAELERPEAAAAVSAQRLAAKQRAAAERHTRLLLGLAELEKIRVGKTKTEQAQARVSLTDPEARNMKDGHGGFAPSYNLQLTTDVKNKIIVDVNVTQQSNDQKQLAPALERLQPWAGRMIVDGGYITADSIAAASAAQVELVGPEYDPVARAAASAAVSLKAAGIAPEYAPSFFIILGGQLQCPAGKMMEQTANNAEYTRYQAQRADCEACAHQSKCCPKSGHRSVKVSRPNPEVAAFAASMKEEKNKELYKQRGPVAEFPNAWIKAKHKLRQFHVRGLVKVGTEALWSAFTHNIQQWFRLAWLPQLVQA